MHFVRKESAVVDKIFKPLIQVQFQLHNLGNGGKFWCFVLTTEWWWEICIPSSILKSQHIYFLVSELSLRQHSSLSTNIPRSSHPSILSFMYPLHRWKVICQWCHTTGPHIYCRDFPSFSLYVFPLECHTFQFLVWAPVPMSVSCCGSPSQG